MNLKYLLDENVDPIYRTELTRLNSDLFMWVVGVPNAPPRGTLDSEIILWCEEYDFALVTNNRSSMPVHLNDHIAAGHHAPGIFILSPKLSIGQNIDELIFIALASFENEYQDKIVYLPHTYLLPSEQV